MNFKAVKSEARATAVARRKALHDPTGAAAQRMVAFALGLASHMTGHARVSAYMPIRTEIDTLPLLNALHQHRHKVCVPVVTGAGQALGFRDWHPGIDLVKGEFGVPVPAGGPWVCPHLLFVPLLAFDEQCYRLGYGGGFYDRTLAKLSSIHPIQAFGVAYAGQQVPELPLEKTDVQLDGVVTESGIIRPD